MPSPKRDVEMGEIQEADRRSRSDKSKSHSRSTSRYNSSSHYRPSRSSSQSTRPRSYGSNRSRSRSRYDSNRRRSSRSPDRRRRSRSKSPRSRDGRKDNGREASRGNDGSSSSKRKLEDISSSRTAKEDQRGSERAKDALSRDDETTRTGSIASITEKQDDVTILKPDTAGEAMQEEDLVEEPEEPSISKEEQERRILEERKRRRMEIKAKYELQQKVADSDTMAAPVIPAVNPLPEEEKSNSAHDRNEEKTGSSAGPTVVIEDISEMSTSSAIKSKSPSFPKSNVQAIEPGPQANLAELPRPSTTIQPVAQSAPKVPATTTRPPLDVAALQANIQQALQRVKSVVAELKIDTPSMALEAMTENDAKKEGEEVIGVEKEVAVSSSGTSNGNGGPAGVSNGDVHATDPDHSFDMFDTEAFHTSSRATNLRDSANMSVLGVSEGDDPNLKENWDDAEGYYNARIGEKLFDGKYQVLGVIGKGVFSSVVKCVDAQTGQGMVAVKLVRNNDTMRKAAQKELSILQELSQKDPEDRKHVVRLLNHFEHRSHTALVFEAMNMNLREVLKKFGKHVGVSLSAVRIYARQMFIALYHLQSCKVVHADIKPDNILVNESYNALKLCDFGSAFHINDPDNDPTPYLVSRYYRAPEIILGLAYDYAIDMWSIGCCLYEIFTGKVLFPGGSNNDMLRLMMDIKGKPSSKMLKRHRVAYDRLMIEPHFDDDNKFRHHDLDRVTGKVIVRVLEPVISKDLGSILLASRASKTDRQMVLQLKDLLEKCFIIDPSKRLTVKEALAHPFVKK